MKRKGISLNLKLMMVIVILVIVALVLFTLMSDNVNFFSSYGNKTINNSIGAKI